jgi:hypothetical protein
MPAVVGVEYGGFVEGVASDPGHGSYLVTPSNTDNLPIWARSVYVVGAGDLKVTNIDGTISTIPLPANYIWPVRVKRIWADSTVTGIHAIY